MYSLLQIYAYLYPSFFYLFPPVCTMEELKTQIPLLKTQLSFHHLLFLHPISLFIILLLPYHIDSSYTSSPIYVCYTQYIQMI
jgi:hypothetical protein